MTTQGNFGTFDNRQCCIPCTPTEGERGVTYWNLDVLGIQATIDPNSEINLSFTPTEPGGWAKENGCAVYFYTSVSNPSSTIESQIWFSLNTIDNYSRCCIPGPTGIGNWQAFDVSFQEGTVDYFNTLGLNTIYFSNGPAATICISTLQIINEYAMQDLSDQNKYGPSPQETSTGTLGALDPGVDYPCNFQTGGCRSVTDCCCGAYNLQTLTVGNTFAWTFDFSTFPTNNYVAGDLCLFGFNKIFANTDSNNPYVKLDATLNGNFLQSYYLSPKGVSYDGSNRIIHPLYPAYDLMQSPHYVDNGINTITLTNNSNNDVDVVMEDDHGINITRIYKTHPVSLIVDTYTDGNGQIQPSGAVNVAWNSTPAFTITPNSGYEISSIVLDSANSSTNLGALSQYTLSPVTKSYMLAAYFQQIPCYCELGCQGCEGTCMSCQPCEYCQVGCENCLDCEPCQGCEYACQDFCMYCEGT